MDNKTNNKNKIAKKIDNKIDIKKINLKELCDIMLRIGKMIHSSGGEANRVERTLSRLGKAYGCDKVEVMSIAHSIIVTLSRAKDSITEIRRIEESQFDFFKLKRTNRVYREIIKKPLSIEDINKKLDTIERSDKINNFFNMLVSWCIASAFYTGFFGGNALDMICSGIIGIILCTVIKILSPYKINYYFTLIIVSLLGGFLSRAFTWTGLNIHTSVINAGNIMPLIPGLTLTNSLRDMLSKDTITGMSEIAETVVISLIIATGFALTTFNIEVYYEPNYVTYMICGFFSSLGFALLFNQEKTDGIIAALVSILGWLMVLIIKDNYNMEILGYFVASMFMTLMSEILARRRKCPATIFLIQGILILVPGFGLYRTMFYYVSGSASLAAFNGTKTLECAAAIAFGILTTTAIVDAWVNRKISKTA